MKLLHFDAVCWKAWITVRLEEHFADNPLNFGGVFNHYRPARYLAENVSDLEVPAAVLDRFEQVFKAVNECLVRSGEQSYQ